MWRERTEEVGEIKRVKEEGDEGEGKEREMSRRGKG